MTGGQFTLVSNYDDKEHNKFDTGQDVLHKIGELNIIKVWWFGWKEPHDR